ncbi:MAG: glycosyltransferase family 4 protein [Ruminococcus sp.]|jgi:1,2-diacylglycerol-3-alpha-glucose alpha-1,2-glucosyltransferase
MEKMKIYIYKGGLSVVSKSGVGSAIRHQEQMLRETGAPLAENWKEASVIHINTVFPDAAFAAYAARKQGKKVVYYGHSTMEDFCDSFIGSNRAAAFFKKWICRCYSLGDVILTPTEYSRRLLTGYGLKPRIYAVTNGVDTGFFHKDAEMGRAFRRKYRIPDHRKAVISAGHLIPRKGIFDFLKLAAGMPEVLFIWFGGGNLWAVPPAVKRAIKKKTENVIFAGYVKPEELKAAYCGADAFAFFSYEETEGIVVLEALACEIPVIVRDIPVYEDWLKNGVHVYKAGDIEEFRQGLESVFYKDCSDMTGAGRKLAEEHSIRQTGLLLNEIYQMEQLGEGGRQPCVGKSLRNV